MKPALTCFSVLTSLSLWFGAQGTPPTCRGKPLSITLLPGPKMTGPELPLRFGGTRPLPRPPINNLRSDNPFRLVIKNRDEFTDFWKRFVGQVSPSDWVPPLPEIDFSKEMVVVAVRGERPSCCNWTIIDGACEVEGQVEVFVSNVDDIECIGHFPVVTYPADAVRLPQTDLPIVFREAQIPCTQWVKQMKLLER
jgi:hypothetical protein